MRHVVILAGGSGTRLWPLSRKGEPKQLINLTGGPTLLRRAYERVAGVIPDAQILVCAGDAYTDTVAEQLPELPAENILGEPVGRDSLNAVAWSTALAARRDPEAVVAVLSADQIITPVGTFVECLETAYRLVEADPSALATFGVIPTTAHTGYGYLLRGADVEGFPGCNEVVEFKEKPTAALAAEYLESGRYWWNSGMFVWNARTFSDQLAQLLPETAALIDTLVAHPDKIPHLYPALLKISVDYAIMEPVSRGEGSAHVVSVGLPVSWVDLGGFQSLFENLPADDHGNRRRGPVVTLDAAGNLLINTRGEGTVLAVVGLTGMVVVTTPTATLAVPLARSQDVKALVAKVGQELSAELG